MSKSLFGRRLKYFRQVQGLSQLSLATLASTTTRHVSFLENGRSRPSDKMVIRLAEALEVPVRERNSLLESAGYEGVYPVQDLGIERSAAYMAAVRYTLASHAPFPAMVKNRYHEVIELNESAKRLFMLDDPKGLGGSLIDWVLNEESPAIKVFENYEGVAWSMIFQIRGEAVAAPHDERLQELARTAEKRAKSLGPARKTEDLVMCPVMHVEGHRISLMGLDAQFASAQEANLEELRIALMYPRDQETEEFFTELQKAPPLRVAK